MNCLSRGLDCDNQIQLKWQEEFEAHGRAFGRQGVWSKVSPQRPRGPSSPGRPSAIGLTKSLTGPLSIEPHYFIHTFRRDLECDTADQCEGDGRNDARYEEYSVTSTPGSGSHLTSSPFSYHSASLPVSPSPYPRLDGFDPGLLEYYLLRLCPLTIPSQCIKSPFADLILPLFASGGHEFVLLSVMSFSARHRSLTDPRWSRIALSLKGRVLTALRQRIGIPDLTANAIADPQIPIAMMFLCLDEIVDNCDRHWVIHLRASQDLLYRRKKLLLSPVSASEHSLVALAERFFAFQDVISRTACGSSPHFGLEYWQSPEREADVEGWIGCSPTLAAKIFRITELGRARGCTELSRDEFERQAGSLEEELDSLTSESDDDLTLRSQDNDHDDNIKSDCLRSPVELMQEAVKLYHHCLLYNAAPSTPLVIEIVSKILQKTHDLVQAGSVAGLAFPLFVAAVELDPLTDETAFLNAATGERTSGRRLVLDTLRTMSGSALFNVAKTSTVIRKIWAMRDLRLGDDQATSASPDKPTTELNDWNIYVSPYSSNISLA
jgi:hypothetical protein